MGLTGASRGPEAAGSKHPSSLTRKDYIKHAGFVDREKAMAAGAAMSSNVTSNFKEARLSTLSRH